MRLALPCYPVCQPANLCAPQPRGCPDAETVSVTVTLTLTLTLTLALTLTLETLDNKILAGWHTG